MHLKVSTREAACAASSFTECSGQVRLCVSTPGCGKSVFSPLRSEQLNWKSIQENLFGFIHPNEVIWNYNTFLSETHLAEVAASGST